MIIHVEYGDRNSIVELTETERNELKDCVKKEDQMHGFDVSDDKKYSRDDYLYIAFLVRQVISYYNRMNYIPVLNQWRAGYREVPYIHVELFDGCAMIMRDGILVPNDKDLTVQITGPDNNNCYTLYMDRNYLFRYIQFLQQIFDKNQEFFTDLSNQEAVFGDGHTGYPAEHISSEKRVTKDDLLLQALQLKQQGFKDISQTMLNYALTLPDDANVIMPRILFVNNRFDGLTFFDEHRKAFVTPLKKQIYNTSGFAKYFSERNSLIFRIFEESLLTVISHEFFHVANGHCLLGKNNPDYIAQKKVRICAEQNADDSAIRLQLSEPLFHGKSGNPHDYELEYTADELVELWALRGFSIYLSLSWMYRGEDREWDDGTLERYLQSIKVKHPLYQFRTFNSVNRIINHLSGILGFEESNQFKTVDGYAIDENLLNRSVEQTMDLINSFESCFEICYGEEERSLQELLDQSWRVEARSEPTETKKVPYCMPIFNSQANDEIRAIMETWTELKQALEKSGTYSMLYKTI